MQGQPTVTDFRPESGASSSEPRIYGAGVNATTTSNTVEIGGASVTPDSGSISIEQEVSVTGYNGLGQRVRTPADGSRQAGIHAVRWKGENRYGDPVGSDISFYRIEATEISERRKMMLVR